MQLEESYPHIQLPLCRQEIETCDLTPVIHLFRQFDEMMEDDDPVRFIGCVSFFIGGYEDDPRELWKISAIKTWFKALEKDMPFILFFLCPDDGTVNLFYTATQYTCYESGAYACPATAERFVEHTVYVMDRYLESFDINHLSCEPYLRHCDAVTKTLSSDIRQHLH